MFPEASAGLPVDSRFPGGGGGVLRGCAERSPGTEEHGRVCQRGCAEETERDLID